MNRVINKKIGLPLIIILLAISAAFFVLKSFGKETPEESLNKFVYELIQVGEENSTEQNSKLYR